MEVTTEGLFLSVVFILGVLLFHQRNKHKIPPGPFRLPLIGNLYQLICKNPYKKLETWTNKYGKIFTVHIGTKKAFFISDVKLMRQVFGQMASTGKFQTETLLAITRGAYGIPGLEGKASLEQRTFCLKNLKEFGLWKMEPLILAEIQDVIDWIKSEGANNTPVLLFDTLMLASANSLWTLMNGKREKLSESAVRYIIPDMLYTIQRSARTGLMFMPWLKHLAPELSGFNALDRASINLHEFVKSHINEHKTTFTPGESRDFIDCCLQELENAKNDPSSSFHGSVGILNTVGTIATLFGASGGTTSGTLVFLLFYLGVHPNIQEKVHEEIDRVIGKDRTPSLTDRANLPYLDACLLETFRYSSIAPWGVIHRLMEDVQADEYVLPKNSFVVANIYCAHKKVSDWKDPENFRPERFLQPGNEKLRDLVIPFQVGKRSCPGEPVARDTLFLFSTRVLQTFSIRPDPATPRQDYLEPDLGFMQIPKPRKLVLTLRTGF